MSRLRHPQILPTPASSGRSLGAELVDREEGERLLRRLVWPRPGTLIAEDGTSYEGLAADDPRVATFLDRHGPEPGRGIRTRWDAIVAGEGLAFPVAILRLEARDFRAPTLSLGFPLPESFGCLRKIAQRRHVMIASGTRGLGLDIGTPDFRPVRVAHAAALLVARQ